MLFLGNIFYIIWIFFFVCLYVLSLVVLELYEAKHEGLDSISYYIMTSNKKDLDN